MESKIEIDNDNIVYLGFAEKGKESDFNIKNFPSKLGGLPIWIAPLENNINKDFFKCNCGQNLSFLLQIYCPLNDFDNAFHRFLYIFYCDKCWKYKNNVKVLRINLPEESSYFNGENIKNISFIKEDKLIKEVNDMLSENIIDEYLITTSEEKKEASKLYFSYYNECEEKSLKSNESLSNIFDDDEDPSLKISDKNELNEYKEMTKKYLLENPNININKIEVETEEEKENDKILNLEDDIIFNVFSSVVNYNNTQILRYYRNNYFPLWFTKKNILTVSSTKCKNCKNDIEFEFQIMPYLFLLEKKISFIDIGTIVIYTCKNCCLSKKEGGFVEEYGFIQRTGENFRDLNDNDNKKGNIKYNDIQKEVIHKQYNFFKGVNENNVDEDGFVEVKQKKKGKKKKEEFSDDDDINDDI